MPAMWRGRSLHGRTRRPPRPFGVLRPGMSRAAAACAGVALWFSFGALAFTDADTARRVGLLPPIWWLPLFVLGALALTAAIRLSDRGSVLLFLSALILLPWL